MINIRWAAALAFVLVVNAWVLAGAAWNRAGTPEAALELTERELPLSRHFRSDENSGLALSLELCHGCPGRDWFDEEKLSALGFDPEGVRKQDGARRKWPLPRYAYIVLEYNGPAWEAALQQRRRELETLREQGEPDPGKIEDAEERLRRMEKRDSRLLAVDVGSDPEALRRRYGDNSRYLIAPAEIGMQRCWGDKCKEPVYGRISHILGRTIHVPAQYHATLAQAFGSERAGWPWGMLYYQDDVSGPRYRVRLHYGARYEPWLTAVEPNGPEG